MVEHQTNKTKIAGTVGRVVWKIRERLETELAGRARQTTNGSIMNWDELVDDCENILAEYQEYLATDPSHLQRLDDSFYLDWHVEDSLECFYSDALSFGVCVGIAARQIINDELRLHGIALCQRGYLTMEH